jgi:hypothetical protein
MAKFLTAKNTKPSFTGVTEVRNAKNAKSLVPGFKLCALCVDLPTVA